MKYIKKNVGFKITLNIFLFLFFSASGSALISAFASLVGIPVGITSSVVGLKICAITAEIKK